MKYTQDKLKELQNELKDVVKDVGAGKLTHDNAAEKIVHLREEIHKILKHLRKATA